jgi:hypothetical protein
MPRCEVRPFARHPQVRANAIDWADSLVNAGARFMRCYFLRGGRIAGVEILPLGLSDEDSIARAHTLKALGPVRWLRGLGPRPFRLQESPLRQDA